MSSSSALAPPAPSTPRRSSRSPRRRRKGKGKSKGTGDNDDDGDDASSRASSVSPAPSPSPSRSAPRTPSSSLANPPQNASTLTPTKSTASPLPSALKKSPSSPASASSKSASIHPFPQYSFLRHVIEPKTGPVTLLHNPPSQLFRHVQPALVLAYFAARFPALVADPVAALASDSLVVGGLQLAWCMACVPPYAGGSVGAASSTGSSNRLRTKGSKSRLKGTPSKVLGASSEHHSHHRSENPSLPSRFTTALLSVPLTLAATVPLLILVVLFGAPATTHGWHTILLSLHMSLLGVLPLVYAHGVDTQAWWETAGLMLPCDVVSGSAAGACVGAWLGAIPIPLDWDRDWQNWPITIVTGAYLGSIAGRYLGAYVLFGKRLSLEDDEQTEGV